MYRSTLFLALLLTGAAAFSQAPAGKQSIEKLCGCYNIEFKYAETFSPDTAYKFHPRDYSYATELALPIEVTDTKISIQHLLLISDDMIIKHWREDWVYEPTTLLHYEGDKHWVKDELKPQESKGKWAQTVWEVDDAPRYQGMGTWVSSGDKTYWENTTNAPLPRREYTVRSDYNILKRGNRIALTDAGWVHEQDNEKLLRAGGKDKLIAQEKGYNIYTRTKDSECAAAKAYWEKNKAFWETVRAQWQQTLAKNPQLTLKTKADGKPMYEYFDALLKQWSSRSVAAQELPGKVDEVLAKFLEKGDAVSAK